MYIVQMFFYLFGDSFSAATGINHQCKVLIINTCNPAKQLTFHYSKCVDTLVLSYICYSCLFMLFQQTYPIKLFWKTRQRID